MTSRWTLAGLAMLLVAAGAGGTVTRADSGPYSIQDLGLPGLDSVALAVDSGGVAVGASASGAGVVAFRQVDGAGPEALPDVGGGNTTATGVNAAGQVALAGDVGGGTFHAFRLDAGASSATDLEPGAMLAQATGIDAEGRVVGYALLGGIVQAVRWSDAGTEIVGNGGGDAFSVAYGTSDNGTVVGVAGNSPFKWTSSGGHVFLPSPGGFGVAHAANDLGDVVGYSMVNMALVGTLWPAAGGAPVELAGFAQANDINAHGQVVGYGQAGDVEHALLWQAGATVDLNALLEPGSGWVLTRAHAINDAGQIVGEGTFGGLRRGFLMTPPALADTTPPVIASVVTTPDAIWPPRHEMIPVSVSVSATDDSGETPDCQVTGVTSSDPDNGGGDGDTAGDSEVTGPLSVSVRAERSGPVGARLYTVHVDCRDGSGNAAASAGTVRIGELDAVQKKAAKKGR